MPDSNKREVIEVLDVTPAPNEKGGVESACPIKQKSNVKWLWIGFIVLLVLVVYVVFLLPRTLNKSDLADTENHNSQQSVVVEKSIADKILPDSAQHEEIRSVDVLQDSTQLQAKLDAEKLLTTIIELEAELTKHAVNKWATEEFAETVEQGRIGDEYFRQRQYISAIESFQSAIDKLKDLQQRIQPTFDNAIMRGEQSLELGDQPAALNQFELAKAIFPQDERASNGWQRAQTLKELFALLQRGSSFEFHNQLQQAKSVYQEALALDLLSTEATTAIQRVDIKLKDEEYNHIIAVAYQALQNQQYADARAAFKEARNLNPDSTEADIGLNKVAAAMRDAKIANLLFEAEHFVQLQQWAQATVSYEKILKISKKHAAANTGLLDSRAKAKVLNDLKLALNSADQLFKKTVLNNAEQVLSSASGLEMPGSVIEEYRQELEALVRVAVTPITLTLTSDNHTQVVVLKVKRLGMFNKQALQLRPGPYTVVGTRIGYRDVRKTINVTPDSKMTSISIVCDEEI
ncbi:MAG: tetratricopeptide repeat protein [Gammaproteobacteria bacterium]